MCAYKENPNLETSIKSLLNQTQQSTVIVSTSTPNDFIRGLCARYNLQLFIKNGQKGISADWNFGYQQAKTQLVTIAHQDDIYEPTFLEDTLKAYNSSPTREILFSYTGYFEIRNNQHVDSNLLLIIKEVLNVPMRFSPLSSRKFFKRALLALGNPICCPSVTYNKPAIPTDAPFDEAFKNSCDYKA